jgi:hypothetical protein
MRCTYKIWQLNICQIMQIKDLRYSIVVQISQHKRILIVIINK